MKTFLRSNITLLVLSLAICCVAYPAVLYAIGRTFFPRTAEGSLVAGKDVVKGSHLIAQPFTGDEYFWPRPSAASYNGAASSGSNYGASNPKLRERVSQQLGPMVVYKNGSKSAGPDASKPRSPQKDIEVWFAAQPKKEGDEKLEPAAIHANYFDAWIGDPANKEKAADLEPVIADMVMASGSGLDPHITLRNALSVYQLDRIAKKRTPVGGNVSKTRGEIEVWVKQQSIAPLGGLVGEPLVNVLELNLALDEKWPLPK